MADTANFSTTYTCTYCNREFEVTRPEIWAYKYDFGEGIRYFHTWSCYRQAQREHRKNVILRYYNGREFIGTDLTKQMERQNISQKKLSEISSISQQRVSNYKNNNRACELDTIKRLELALGCKLICDDKEKVLQPRFDDYFYMET